MTVRVDPEVQHLLPALGGNALGNSASLKQAWSNRKAIAINHARVAGPGSLTNFPMLFAVTDPNLKTVANSGSVGKADGVTKLDHELERYNAATGEAVWIGKRMGKPGERMGLLVILDTWLEHTRLRK